MLWFARCDFVITDYIEGFTPKNVGTQRQDPLDSTRCTNPEDNACRNTKFRHIECRETYVDRNNDRATMTLEGEASQHRFGYYTYTRRQMQRMHLKHDKRTLGGYSDLRRCEGMCSHTMCTYTFS